MIKYIYVLLFLNITLLLVNVYAIKNNYTLLYKSHSRIEQLEKRTDKNDSDIAWLYNFQGKIQTQFKHQDEMNTILLELFRKEIEE